MSPDPALFPESTTLRQEPPCPEALDPRRGAAWAAITTRFANVFAKPSRLPPYRFVNGGCTLKDEGTVPPRAGVGRLSREEITYTRAILCDYLDKGWIRPSYSRTPPAQSPPRARPGQLSLRRKEEREFFIDNLLVRIHYIVEMILWTGLAP